MDPKTQMPKFFSDAALEVLHFYCRLRVAVRRKNPLYGVMRDYRRELYERAWRDAAQHLGADLTDLGGDFYEISANEKKVKVYQNYTSLDNMVNILLALDKSIVVQLLLQYEIPMANQFKFDYRDLPAAAEYFGKMKKPVVVKPADGTAGGHGVTANINSLFALTIAAANARVCCPRILIEEQIEGDNYRLLYVDGDLIDCVIRQPPNLVGDGTSTIRQLVRDENRNRFEVGLEASQVPLSIDLDMRHTLSLQGLKLSSVPSAGERVKVKHVVGENRRDDNRTASDKFCDSTVELGRRIVSAIGLRVAGIDIITKDPSVPLSDSGGVLLEVNAPPGFYYHYHKQDGRTPIANEILRRGLAP